ncbi:response regulator transcription factor [Thermicanus aegyptius]|uniref:response regulator transcription factor n=1 Tax=Thermicanus aegyptius TaxID=94009 RepID=UPI00048E26E4|nr:helix-turn-helix transcriptional regulator [Thermicanus aegyptius]
MYGLNDVRRNDPGIHGVHVGREELEALLEVLNDRSNTSGCNEEIASPDSETNGESVRIRVQTERQQMTTKHLELLKMVSSLIGERVRRKQQMHGLMRDMIMVITDQTLQIVRVIDPEALSSVEWQRRLKGLVLARGMLIDEWHFGAQAFTFARKSKGLKAVWGLEHSCPNLKEVWTVAAPIKIRFCHVESDLIGYAGLIIDARKEVEGYAAWLSEMLIGIEERFVPERDWYKNFKRIRPSVAVRLPEMVTKLLTPREIEVLELLIAGFNIKAIAKKLFVEKTTVKTHIRRIAEKFNVENTIEALFRCIDDVNRHG